MPARIHAAAGLLVALGLSGLAVWAFTEAVLAEPAVVGSIATAVAGVFGVLWRQRRSEQARLREAHRDRMTHIYDELLGLISQQFGADSDTDDPGDEMVAFMKDFKGRQLLLGASSEMIRAFNEWQAATRRFEKEENPTGAVFAWENLLWAIRADLGHDDSDLARGDLLRIFITDYDEHVAAD